MPEAWNATFINPKSSVTFRELDKKMPTIKQH